MSQSFFQNKKIGGIFLIAGTTVGAGILGLPLAASMIGLWPSILIMIGIWLLMYKGGIVHQAINSKGHTLTDILKKEFGKPLEISGILTLYGLFYALLCAYMTGASSVIVQALPNFSEQIIQFAFTFLLGGMMMVGMNSLDRVNRLLCMLKAGLFVVFAGCLFVFKPIHTSLNPHVHVSFSSIAQTMSIFFYLFWFPWQSSFCFSVCGSKRPSPCYFMG